MSRVVSAATAELQAISGVESVGAHVGRAITSDEVVDVHSGEIWVTIGSGANYDSTASAIQEVVDGYPGLSSSVGSYAAERVNADLAGSGRDVTARVYGENLTVLREKADEVLAAMSGVDGVENARIEAPIESPALEIEVDLEATERYGIAPGDVRRTAATLLSGLNVGQLFEKQKVFDVVVWSTPETRSSVTAIQNLAIDTADGNQVRLADVADVRIAPNLAVVNRESVSRYIDVTADTDGAGVKNDIETCARRDPVPAGAPRRAARQRRTPGCREPRMGTGHRRRDPHLPPPPARLWQLAVGGPRLRHRPHRSRWWRCRRLRGRRRPDDRLLRRLPRASGSVDAPRDGLDQSLPGRPPGTARELRPLVGSWSPRRNASCLS